jgi:hypothetical protein
MCHTYCFFLQHWLRESGSVALYVHCLSVLIYRHLAWDFDLRSYIEVDYAWRCCLHQTYHASSGQNLITLRHYLRNNTTRSPTHSIRTPHGPQHTVSEHHTVPNTQYPPFASITNKHSAHIYSNNFTSRNVWNFLCKSTSLYTCISTYNRIHTNQTARLLETSWRGKDEL